MSLSVQEVEFLFETTGDLTGESYVGKFSARPILTFLQKSVADLERRNFLGNPQINESVDENTAATAFILSQLKVRLVKGPTWYQETNFLKDLLDENVAIELYK